ncbi:MAG: bis(5'-nucleosyl)-tetraphosphatase [bacterium]
MPETHTSAGIIPLDGQSNPNYLLLKYPQGHWGFPKGHLEDDDASLWDGAVRELKEETNLELQQRFEEFRSVLDYWFTQDNRRHHKTVYFFAGTVSNREVTLSHEHTDYCWMNADQTLEKITYDNEKNLFRDWLNYYQKRNTDRSQTND